MLAPWDRPPLPRRGNLSLPVLFESIGRTLNAWEEIEISMAHLHAACDSGNRFDERSGHEYGDPPNFRQRAAMLQESFCRYCCRRPSQEIEGEFMRLMRLVDGYSARRNDIAHGHVLWIDWAIRREPRRPLLEVAPYIEWCVVPPHFRANKFTDDQRPAYALTSREINEYGKVFGDIAAAMSNLSIWTIQHAPVPLHGIRPRPGALPYTIRVPRIRKG
jgi:hypothetical protein